MRYVRGLEGCCVDALVADVIGTTPETEWAAAVGAMRRRARRARTGLRDLPERGPMPATQVQEYVEYFRLRLVVVCAAGPGGRRARRERAAPVVDGRREGGRGGGGGRACWRSQRADQGQTDTSSSSGKGSCGTCSGGRSEQGLGGAATSGRSRGERRRTRQGRFACGIRARTWRRRGADEARWSAGLRRGRVTVIARR